MAGSRRRGWGAIRSRKVKGGVSYYASYRDPVDGSERVTAPHAFSSREDAEGWLAAERRLVESGSWIHPRERLERARREREAVEARAVSFGEFAERWLARKVRDDKVKPRTRATYRHLLDRHLLPVFGGTPVRDITPDMVASWYESLAGTPGARAGAYGLLKRVLASACEPPGRCWSSTLAVSAAGRRSGARSARCWAPSPSPPSPGECPPNIVWRCRWRSGCR